MQNAYLGFNHSLETLESCLFGKQVRGRQGERHTVNTVASFPLTWLVCDPRAWGTPLQQCLLTFILQQLDLCPPNLPGSQGSPKRNGGAVGLTPSLVSRNNHAAAWSSDLIMCSEGTGRDTLGFTENEDNGTEFLNNFIIS